MLALLLVFLFCPARSSDLVFEGASDLRTQRPLEVSPIDRGQLDEALDVAEQVDPQAGARLRNAINSGAISVGVLPESFGSNWGFHDFNTIGVNKGVCDRMPTALALVLLHEFGHVEPCGGGPTQGGSVNDPTVTPTSSNPCAPANHLTGQAATIAQACEACCNASAREMTTLCVLIDDTVQAMYDSSDRALRAGCPPASVPDPALLYPEFCHCNC